MYYSPRFSSCRGGALLKVLVFVIIFCGVITAAWIFFLPMILSSTLTKRTGFDVQVQRLTLNPFVAEVDLEGLVIHNPHTFPRPDYVTVQLFKARAPFKTLFSDRPEFDYVKVDVPHVTFVRNTDGTLNATLFYDRLFPSDHPSSDETPSSAAPAPKASTQKKVAASAIPKKTRFLIHRLELKVDHITWDDQYSRTPSTREFNVGINQVYDDVTDAEQLLNPATLRAVSPAAAAISGLIPGELGQVFRAAAGGASQRDSMPQFSEPAKTMVDTLEESRKP
jgi:hypothetical protein